MYSGIRFPALTFTLPPKKLAVGYPSETLTATHIREDQGLQFSNVREWSLILFLLYSQILILSFKTLFLLYLNSFRHQQTVCPWLISYSERLFVKSKFLVFIFAKLYTSLRTDCTFIRILLASKCIQLLIFHMNFTLQTVNQFFIYSSNFTPSFGSNAHHIANLSCTFTTHNHNVFRKLSVQTL